MDFIGPVDAYTPEASRDDLLAVMQEALSNVARHAHATSVSICIEAVEGTLSIIVTDDGTGIPDNARAGNGLSNLHHRAERLGGTVTVGPGQRSGTVVQLTVLAP